MCNISSFSIEHSLLKKAYRLITIEPIRKISIYLDSQRNGAYFGIWHDRIHQSFILPKFVGLLPHAIGNKATVDLWIYEPDPDEIV